MVADHPQHGVAVLGETGERPDHTGHLGRGGVGVAGEDGGQGTSDGPALVGVVGDAPTHQQRSEVGVAETEGAIVVRALGDLLGREVGHGHRDLEHDGPQPDGVLVGLDVEDTGLVVVELDQVDRGQVARGVVEEDVLGARVGGPDPAAGRGGVPLVDGGVELDDRGRRRPTPPRRSCRQRSRALTVLRTEPSVRSIRSQSPSSITVSMNSLGPAPSCSSSARRRWRRPRR